MRPLFLFVTLFFGYSMLVNTQNKSDAKDQTQQRQTEPQDQQRLAPVVQVNVGTSPSATNSSNAEQKTRNEESKPFMTHGEWAICVITSVYVLISYLTFRAIRVSARQQLRAYVLPESSGILDGTQLNPPLPVKTNVPGVAMVIKNTGQTPAYGVVSWIQISVARPADEHTLTIPPMANQFPNTVGAGGTFIKNWWFTRALTPIEIADIAVGEKAIYVYGRIEYTDVFKKKHYSNFRLHWIGVFPPPMGSILNFSLSGNEVD